jgi:hypothetical protein
MPLAKNSMRSDLLHKPTNSGEEPHFLRRLRTLWGVAKDAAPVVTKIGISSIGRLVRALSQGECLQ